MYLHIWLGDSVCEACLLLLILGGWQGGCWPHMH